MGANLRIIIELTKKYFKNLEKTLGVSKTQLRIVFLNFKHITPYLGS